MAVGAGKTKKIRIMVDTTDRALPVTFAGHGELAGLVGREIAVGGWLDVTQDTIDRFAAVTGDAQWIHTDPARAKAESPYGGTIAHGFLVLGLFTTMLRDSVRIAGTTASINYGLNRLRFTGPVPSGSRIRGRFTLNDYRPAEGGATIAWGVVVEREDEAQPAIVAEWLVRYLGKA